MCRAEIEIGSSFFRSRQFLLMQKWLRGRGAKRRGPQKSAFALFIVRFFSLVQVVYCRACHFIL